MMPHTLKTEEVVAFIKSASIDQVNFLIDEIEKLPKRDLFSERKKATKNNARNYIDLVLVTLIEFSNKGVTTELTDTYWAVKYGNLRWQTHLGRAEEYFKIKLCEREVRFKSSMFKTNKKDRYTVYKPKLLKEHHEGLRKTLNL